ncbi:hypothetical protein [Tepidimonas charontis]|uniref:Lipoprotein n=1 Tax=Tepidimonas charontis TaxID=2267262 RepID=A0A554X7E4_9BURK|nr:hypothetical protein [Tepidimonas charontis]TSE31753.1 hypothetical protein Tchar_02233 [Tepidimonas charontis]
MRGRARRWLLGVWTLALAGCAATPVPAWRLELRQAVEQATAAALEGQQRAAQHQWRRAQTVAAATGQADVLARVALLRCAVDQAALVWHGCPQAAPYLTDASAAEHAYAAYLGAVPAPTEPAQVQATLAQLPAAQRPLAQALWAASGAEAPLTPQLRAIDDPLARLVAGGVAWRAGRLDAAGVAVLVETASEQGWRRPLAAWLAVQAELAERQGAQTEAAAARRRLEWVLQTEVRASQGAAAPAPQ